MWSGTPQFIIKQKPSPHSTHTHYENPRTHRHRYKEDDRYVLFYVVEPPDFTLLRLNQTT